MKYVAIVIVIVTCLSGIMMVDRVTEAKQARDDALRAVMKELR